MLIVPNILKIFEKSKPKYQNWFMIMKPFIFDVANLNTVMEIIILGNMEFCVLHKTFSTPHSCGGPGAGPSLK
jgi:glycine cleavage system protein P-like pyridoxal-binding family